MMGGGHRYSFCKLIQREREVQVSGVAEDAGNAPDSLLAFELRRALDGCPICDGGYRDHSYAILAIVAIEQQWQAEAILRIPPRTPLPRTFVPSRVE